MTRRPTSSRYYARAAAVAAAITILPGCVTLGSATDDAAPRMVATQPDDADGRPSVMAPVARGRPAELAPSNRQVALSDGAPLPSTSEDLVGWTGDRLIALLGEPELRRREPPAEVWQYRADGCVLDLFFYGDPFETGAIHAETRERRVPRGGGVQPIVFEESCIAALIAVTPDNPAI